MRYKKSKNMCFHLRKLFLIMIGAAIAAAGLKLFLVPNSVIDGGVVGLSIMGEVLTGLPFGVMFVAMSLPFVAFGWMRLGKSFALYTMFAIVALSVASGIFAQYPPLTSDPFLAAIFGGIVDGLGVGLIIRYGGSLDGTEIIAIDLDKRSVFSTGEVLMFINIFILSGAGFLYGWDKAMYSLVAYFVISKMIDVVVKGVNESYTAMIVTNKPDELKDILMNEMGRGVTVLHGEGGYSGKEKKVLYCLVSRLEIDRMKEAAKELDDKVFITLMPVNDILGGRFSKTKK